MIIISQQVSSGAAVEVSPSLTAWSVRRTMGMMRTQIAVLYMCGAIFFAAAITVSGYPITLYADADAARCRRQAQELADTLREAMQARELSHLSLIGPAPCFLSRLRGRWRWQVIVRHATQAGHMDDALHELLARLPLPPGWRLDIDPLDIL